MSVVVSEFIARFKTDIDGFERGRVQVKQGIQETKQDLEGYANAFGKVGESTEIVGGVFGKAADSLQGFANTFKDARRTIEYFNFTIAAVRKAWDTGFAIGTWINDVTGLSDKIADLTGNVTNLNNQMEKYHLQNQARRAVLKMQAEDTAKLTEQHHKYLASIGMLDAKEEELAKKAEAVAAAHRAAAAGMGLAGVADLEAAKAADASAASHHKLAETMYQVSEAENEAAVKAEKIKQSTEAGIKYYEKLKDTVDSVEKAENHLYAAGIEKGITDAIQNDLEKFGHVSDETKNKLGVMADELQTKYGVDVPAAIEKAIDSFHRLSNEARALQNMDMSDLDQWTRDYNFRQDNPYAGGAKDREAADARRQAIYDKYNTGNSPTTTRGDRYTEAGPDYEGPDFRSQKRIDLENAKLASQMDDWRKTIAKADEALATVPITTETAFKSIAEAAEVLRNNINITAADFEALAPHVENIGRIMDGISQANGAASGPIWNETVLKNFISLQDSALKLTEAMEHIATGTAVTADWMEKLTGAMDMTVPSIDLFGKAAAGTAAVLGATAAALAGSPNPFALGLGPASSVGPSHPGTGSRGPFSGLQGMGGPSGFDLSALQLLQRQQNLVGWGARNSSQAFTPLAPAALPAPDQAQAPKFVLKNDVTLLLNRRVLYQEMKEEEADDARNTSYTAGRGSS